MTVPETDMTHAIITRACLHCPEHIGECSFNSYEQEAADRSQSSNWFRNPAEQPFVNDCVSMIQSIFNPLRKQKTIVILPQPNANTSDRIRSRANIESRSTARFLEDDDIYTPAWQSIRRQSSEELDCRWSSSLEDVQQTRSKVEGGCRGYDFED